MEGGKSFRWCCSWRQAALLGFAPLVEKIRRVALTFLFLFFSCACADAIFWFRIFKRDGFESVQKKTDMQTISIRWQARTKIFCKDEEEEKMWETFFGYFFWRLVCRVLLFVVEYLYSLYSSSLLVWNRWEVNEFDCDGWMTIAGLFVLFLFSTIFRFASLNSPTMPFARVNRVERLYKFRCLCVFACVFGLGFSFGRSAWRKSPADGMNQQGTTLFYCIPAPAVNHIRLFSPSLFSFFEFSSGSKATTKTNFWESGVIHVNEWQSLEKCDRFSLSLSLCPWAYLSVKYSD